MYSQRDFVKLVEKLHYSSPMWEVDTFEENHPFVRDGILRKHNKTEIFCDCGECNEPSPILPDGRGGHYYFCHGFPVNLSASEMTCYRLDMNKLMNKFAEAFDCDRANVFLPDLLCELGTSSLALGRCVSRPIYVALHMHTMQAIKRITDILATHKSALVIVGGREAFPCHIDAEATKHIFHMCDVIRWDGTDWSVDVQCINDRFAVAPKPKKEKAPTSRDVAAKKVETYLTALCIRLVGIYRSQGYDAMASLSKQITKKFIAEQAKVDYTTCTRIIQDHLPLKKWKYRLVGTLWQAVIDPEAIANRANGESVA